MATVVPSSISRLDTAIVEDGGRPVTRTSLPMYRTLRTQSAPDTIDSAFAFFQEWYVSGQGINNEFFWDKGMRQGGWFPVHPDAAPDDQVFAVRGFLYAMRLIYPVQSIEMLGAMAEQAIEYWLTSTYRDEDARSLAEYLVDIKAFDWA